MAALTAFILLTFFGKRFIAYINSKQFGQVIREEGPKHHYKKKGTPTMGGVLIFFSMFVGVFLWSDLSNPYIILMLGLSFSFGLIGFLDDYLKVIKQHSEGLKSRWKFRLQYIFGLFFSLSAYYFLNKNGFDNYLYFPFFKNLTIDLGIWTVVFSVFLLVGKSNAVNLTDGLDGLALGPSIVCCSVFFILSYLTGHHEFANYLNIPFVSGVGELSVYCSALLASCIAFLWFNSYPAEIIMGDVGSLFLGASFAGLAILTKNELLLLILGGVFVMEAASVILQVLSFKLTGNRIFKMAPIHHHFELIGWPEPKVITRFWVISFALGILALCTLKLR